MMKKKYKPQPDQLEITGNGSYACNYRKPEMPVLA